MIRQYIGNAALTLINKFNYIPVKDENGEYAVNDSMIILQKQESGKLSVIELINGEAIGIDDTAFLLERKRNRLLELEFDGYVNLCEIYVFGNSPVEEKNKIIKNGQYEGYPGKRLLNCYTVMAASGEVQKHFDYPAPVRKLDKILKESFNKQDGAFDQIVEAAHKKLGEMTISLKADKPVVTYMLLISIIAIYLLLYAYAQVKGLNYGKLLIDFGAKDNSKILAGEYWRLITPVFLHANTMHILLNSYSLYSVGTVVERLYGHARFTLVYFAAGLMGNIASFIFSNSPGVGASGAIFGLMGSLLYFGIENKVLFKRYFGYNVILILVINIAYGFSTSGIDNFAHIGGLLGGFLVLGAVGLSGKTKSRLRILFTLMTVAAILAGLLFGFNSKSNVLAAKSEKLYRLIQEKNWKEAEKTGEEILGSTPADEGILQSTLWYTAVAESELGHYDDAIAHARKVVKYNKAGGYYLLGVLHYNSGDLELAREELLKSRQAGNMYSSEINNLLTLIQQRLK